MWVRSLHFRYWCFLNYLINYFELNLTIDQQYCWVSSRMFAFWYYLWLCFPCIIQLYFNDFFFLHIEVWNISCFYVNWCQYFFFFFLYFDIFSYLFLFIFLFIYLFIFLYFDFFFFFFLYFDLFSYLFVFHSTSLFFKLFVKAQSLNTYFRSSFFFLLTFTFFCITSILLNKLV